MNTVDVYRQTDVNSTNHLLKEYSYLVKRLAYHLHNRLPANIRIEDLLQTGMIGLHEAIKTFDPTKGASFTTYANLKIRGFMLDDLRSNEWLPRSVQDNSRKITAAIHAVENRSGREATPTDIANELGVPIETYHSMLKDLNATRILDITDPMAESEVPDTSVTPLQTMDKQQMKTHLAKLIDKLPDREKMLLSLYYFEDLNFKEIGKILNITESRVSQIHAQSLTRLKARFDQL